MKPFVFLDSGHESSIEPLKRAGSMLAVMPFSGTQLQEMERLKQGGANNSRIRSPISPIPRVYGNYNYRFHGFQNKQT